MFLVLPLFHQGLCDVLFLWQWLEIWSHIFSLGGKRCGLVALASEIRDTVLHL